MVYGQYLRSVAADVDAVMVVRWGQRCTHIDDDGAGGPLTLVLHEGTCIEGGIMW